MNTIHLIGYGEVLAKPARELKTGDVLIFNYGIKAIVKSADVITARTIRTVITEDGKDFNRDFRLNRLVAFEQKHNHTDDSGTFACPLGSTCKLDSPEKELNILKNIICPSLEGGK